MQLFVASNSGKRMVDVWSHIWLLSASLHLVGIVIGVVVVVGIAIGIDFFQIRSSW